ncbi:MAG: hypothetical protein HOC71_12990 [Candidatus Latescibacteria bacterium]|jgi:hypothetical protein|nr:hypothetical protein [Candidatus Latescibacterota bacterium]
MTWEGTVEETPITIPERIYNAFPVRIIQTESKYGPSLLIYFKLETEDEFDGQEVTGICSYKIHGKSKLGEWIKAITGELPAPGAKIKEDSILLKPCKVEIKHTRKNNETVFANVETVLPPAQETTNDSDTPF